MHVFDSCVCQYEKINNKCTFCRKDKYLEL